MKKFICSLLAVGLIVGTSYADIGENSQSFTGRYGNPFTTKALPNGQIIAWKPSNSEVIMAEFGPSGEARNVAYRTKELSESGIEEYLSRNTSTTGAFYKVDRVKLDSLLNKLSTIGSSQDAPPEVVAFAQKMNPQATAKIRQSLSSIADLRATVDGKYLAMIDPRGSVVVMNINGPQLPLLN